jgi:hypothetical protein
MPSQYEDITVPVFDAREEGWLSDCDGKREEESTSHVDLDASAPTRSGLVEAAAAGDLKAILVCTHC